MIGLSKVFPTLDCSSCITTPKMAAVAHHPNITTLTYTEVRAGAARRRSLRAVLRRKPRYVIEEDCIGCRQCEYACPVEVPDEFEGGMGARRAAYIPFTNAIPQTARHRPRRLHPLRPLRDRLPDRRRGARPGAGDRRGRRPGGHRDDRLAAHAARGQGGVSRRARSPTCSRPRRWSGCWRRTVPTAACCGRPTARCPSRSPTCSAPARATRRSACPTARASAACTRSSRRCC